jgi:hypothetical protein
VLRGEDPNDQRLIHKPPLHGVQVVDAWGEVNVLRRKVTNSSDWRLLFRIGIQAQIPPDGGFSEK